MADFNKIVQSFDQRLNAFYTVQDHAATNPLDLYRQMDFSKALMELSLMQSTLSVAVQSKNSTLKKILDEIR